jgi:excinuclease ABC subunit C
LLRDLALLRIPGVGPKKRSTLLATFGSLQGVREATLEQIAAVEGFSEKSARNVLQALGVLPPDASTEVELGAATDAPESDQ